MRDRRVRRSRSALTRATVSLVTARGTAAVPLSDIAEAADLSRQVVYQQFGDRDTLLLETALDLVQRELLPTVTDTSRAMAGHDRALAMARHFADHRVFYRAILTSPCGYAFNKAMAGLLLPFQRWVVAHRYGVRLDARAVDDIAAFITGGAATFVNTWVVEGEDPLDPEEFTDRLLRAITVIATAIRQSPTATPGQEPGPDTDREPGR